MYNQPNVIWTQIYQYQTNFFEYAKNITGDATMKELQVAYK